MRRFYAKGIKEINGHLMYRISDDLYAEADQWLDRTGLSAEIDEAIKKMPGRTPRPTSIKRSTRHPPDCSTSGRWRPVLKPTARPLPML